jgi:hypothetical protein
VTKSKGSKSNKASAQDLEEKLGRIGRKRLEEATDLIADVVDEMLPEDASFEEYERAVLEVANEIARRRLERKLQGIADRQPLALRIDHNDDWHGVGFGELSTHEFRRHLPGTVTYHSLVGPLQVCRYTYRQCIRNGVTYVPLELEVGIMERMTPGLAKCTAFAFSQVPVREAERLLRAAGRCPPSRATLDRSAKDLGAYAMACNDEIEPEVRATEILPPGTVAIALGLDRTAVAMRNPEDHEHLEAGLRRSRPKGQPRARARGVSWRMDYIGTVTFLDSNGDRLDSRHYRLRANANADIMVDRMIADLRHALEQNRTLRIIVVQDGAQELWNLIRPRLKAEPLVKKWEEVLDWYHVDERLTACLDLSCSTPQERERKRARWHAHLLEERDGAKAFLHSLRGFGKTIPGASKDKFDEHLNYFGRRTKLLGYRLIRQKKLPIGSGVTEGACKSLVGTRAKRSGQHWTQRGLTAALHLRSLDQSGRFDCFWELFAQRYRASALLPLIRA